MSGSGDEGEVDPLDLVLEGKRVRRSWRAVPDLLRQSLGLVWSASRSDFLIALVLQLTPAVLIGVQVLLARNLLSALLSVDRNADDGSALVVPAVLLALVSGVAGGCLIVYQQQQRVLNEVVQREVWRRILHVTASVELASFEDPSFFDQLKRVEQNALTRPVQVAQSAITLLGGLLGSIGVTIALLALEPLLLPLLALAAVPLIVFARRGARTEFGFVVEQTPIHRERFAVQELLTERDPAKELRAFGLQSVLSARWSSRYATYLSALRRQVRLRVRLSLLGSGLAALVAGGAGALLVGLVVTGRLSVADAGAAALAARALASRAGQSVRGSGTLAESSLFLADLHAFFDRADIPVARGGDAAPEAFRTLRVQNVSFAYPTSGNTVISDISLEIQTGEVIALVGENGSGKTTLAKLLARLYEPDTGCICWDDRNIADIDPQDLRRHIAVVFQEFVRYPLPAHENIGLGRAERLQDLEGIREAARHAGADTFLSALPDGYNTYLSKLFKGGRDLSLGQWQRVMLARAFFRNAPFVILDEPTASLDPRAERELFLAIRTLLEGRTVLLISHRFSSVRAADRILVLERGRLIEEGTHDELMQVEGLYRDLFTMQAAAYG